MAKTKNTTLYTIAARWEFFLEWCGRAMWPTMPIGITVQISKTFCISFPLLTCGPRSNSSSLTFIFSAYFVWKSDWSLAQRLLQKKTNYQPVLSHFCNVNKCIYQRKTRTFFPTRLGVVYPLRWKQKLLFLLTDKAPINLRYNQNIRGLHLFLYNQSFLTLAFF